MFNTILKSRFGLVSTVAMVGAVALALFLIPQVGNVNTLAENCQNPPVNPTFNHWPVTYNDTTTPLCHDFPAIDAGKLVTGQATVFSKSEADWKDGLQLNVGEQGVALLYIHNGAANNLDPAQTTAKDVKIITETSTTAGTQHMIKVTYTASNAATYTKSYTVHTPANSKLEVIPNSGQMYTYEGKTILDQQNLNLGNSTFALGKLDACFEYSLFLSYKFKVVAVEQPGTPALTIEKTVKNVTKNTAYAKSVAADQNDIVQYQIKVKSTGTAYARNTTVTDNGAAGVTVQPGSTTVDGGFTGSIPGTVNLGDLGYANQPVVGGDMLFPLEKTITYTARVTAASGTLVNTATAAATSVSPVSSTASVVVNTVTQPGPGKLSISKLAKNITTGADYADLVQARTGDRVSFRVTVTNIGASPVTNVKISDVIPNGLTPEGNISIDGTTSGAIASTVNATLGTLNPGQSKVLEFTTQVIATGPATIKNTACSTGDTVAQVCDDASVEVIVVNKPGTPNIVLSKKAFNNNKSVDATTVPADRGNTITFTLTTTNTGTGDAVNYVITDDLSKVLPLADLIEATGASLNGTTLTYPAMTIKAGETVTKTFKVRVKDNLASTLSFQIINTYGNTVTINIPGKTVFEAPRTGSAATSAGVFAGLVTVGFIAFRKRNEIFKFIAA